MAHQYQLAAELRNDTGKGASRRLRRTGKVPGIVYGGGEAAQGISLDGNDLLHKMQDETFFSSIIQIDLGGQRQQAIVRDYQMHPAKRAVLHIDLQRIVATEKLRISVPFRFLNEATCRGVKEGGASISKLLTEVEVSCLPADLPDHIDVDVGPLGVNEMIHLSDLQLPPGVEIPGLAKGGDNDHAVVHVHVLRIEEEPAAEAAAEGAAAPAAGAEANKEAAGAEKKK